MEEWTETVDQLRRRASEALGQPLNHAIIQWYRDGNDYISEHADKSLDIVRGSKIVNVSLGATRLMVLRDKKGLKRQRGAGNKNAASDAAAGAKPKRRALRVPLPNNSLFVLGWDTNTTMTHEIRQDKRLLSEKTEDELDFGGQRVSITFRHIGTYQRRLDGKLYGQGAKCKREGDLEDAHAQAGPQRDDADAHSVRLETDSMLEAFGNENRDPGFDWDANYGCGFDVMNMKEASSLEEIRPSRQAE